MSPSVTLWELAVAFSAWMIIRTCASTNVYLLESGTLLQIPWWRCWTTGLTCYVLGAFPTGGRKMKESVTKQLRFLLMKSVEMLALYAFTLSTGVLLDFVAWIITVQVCSALIVRINELESGLLRIKSPIQKASLLFACTYFVIWNADLCVSVVSRALKSRKAIDWHIPTAQVPALMDSLYLWGRCVIICLWPIHHDQPNAELLYNGRTSVTLCMQLLTDGAKLMASLILCTATTDSYVLHWALTFPSLAWRLHHTMQLLHSHHVGKGIINWQPSYPWEEPCVCMAKASTMPLKEATTHWVDFMERTVGVGPAEDTQKDDVQDKTPCCEGLSHTPPSQRAECHYAALRFEYSMPLQTSLLSEQSLLRTHPVPQTNIGSSAAPGVENHLSTSAASASVGLASTRATAESHTTPPEPQAARPEPVTSTDSANQSRPAIHHRPRKSQKPAGAASSSRAAPSARVVEQQERIDAYIRALGDTPRKTKFKQWAEEVIRSRFEDALKDEEGSACPADPDEVERRKTVRPREGASKETAIAV